MALACGQRVMITIAAAAITGTRSDAEARSSCHGHGPGRPGYLRRSPDPVPIMPTSATETRSTQWRERAPAWADPGAASRRAVMIAAAVAS